MIKETYPCCCEGKWWVEANVNKGGGGGGEGRKKGEEAKATEGFVYVNCSTCKRSGH